MELLKLLCSCSGRSHCTHGLVLMLPDHDTTTLRYLLLWHLVVRVAFHMHVSFVTLCTHAKNKCISAACLFSILFVTIQVTDLMEFSGVCTWPEWTMAI